MSKTIISDTSCLIALTSIDQLQILYELFDEIYITVEVYNEFGESLPNWVTILEVSDKQNNLN